MSKDAVWWRHAVIYQVYPRSFADASGDGVGDLPGVLGRLDYLVALGIDAIWLSPFYPSPQLDGGYDVSDYCDVDPRFGSLSDLDALVAAAHDRGIRVIIDLVPNHCSWEHPKFQAALAAGPGSPERDWFVFREGTGPDGTQPPTDWVSGAIPAWTRIQEADGTDGPWYLHLFDSSQPDWNWQNPQVWDMFDGILRFWLDRGIDGFRVDVSHGLMKHPDWPNWDGLSFGMLQTQDPHTRPPFWDQDEVHEVYRHWRKILNEYEGDRILAAEAWLTPDRLARYVRPDEMHQAFNFAFLEAGWNAHALRTTIDASSAANHKVGAPTTWVLSNHDVIRHATRFGYDHDVQLPFGLGPDDPAPDTEIGLRRARAATAFMLALPGSAYIYQGEELGLPEGIDIPDRERQDPHWISSQGTLRGRDGARVPLPWVSTAENLGFSQVKPWLTPPKVYQQYAVDLQVDDPQSTLNLYQKAIALRAQHGLGQGSLAWLPDLPDEILAFQNQNLVVIANTGDTDLRVEHLVPATGTVILTSGYESAIVAVQIGNAVLFNGLIPGNTTVWLHVDQPL